MPDYRRMALKRGEDGRLDEGSRREIAERVNERLESEEPYEDGRRRLRTIIQLQARRVATFVRGEGVYRPWVGRW